MCYSQKYNLSPADRIVTPLFQTGVTKHHAIYLGFGNDGNEWIAENDFQAGVRLLHAQIFFENHPTISRIEKFAGDFCQRNAAVIRAQQLQGKPYDLFSYNCEHYASEIQSGNAVSDQIKTFFGLAALLALAILVCKS